MLKKNLANNLRRLSRYRAQGTRGDPVERTRFLSPLITAVCRPRPWLSPGMLVTAPAVSGADSGKGLPVRVICTIAFGVRPAFTTSSGRQELDIQNLQDYFVGFARRGKGKSTLS
jgi:hypothetical protein